MSPLDPLNRFSDRVDNYVRYRPTYPAEAIHYLGANVGLSEESVVADVGAGTGIFTRLLLETGARVFAVEPNDAMRGAADAALRHHANFQSVQGTAEATGLPDASVSLITCAQAFHWFRLEETRREFRRILRPGGWCAVIWNTPVVDGSEFAIGYEQIKEKFGTDFEQVKQVNVDSAGRFDVFFGPGKWQRQEFGNLQTLDLDGLKGRMLSSSYAPTEGHPRFGAMLAALEALFHRCQRDNTVQMDYKTEVFSGRFD